MRARLRHLLGVLLLGAIGCAAATPSLDLLEGEEQGAADLCARVSAQRADSPHGSRQHLGAFECKKEKEETEKADLDAAPVRLAHGLLEGLEEEEREVHRLHAHSRPPLIDPIAAHAARGPPRA